MRSLVQLASLDDRKLSQLVQLAVPDTAIGEVMPATPGPATWTPERLQEFVSFHEGRRGAFDGPHGEVSFAILVRGEACGVVRLQQVAPHVLEVGMWLTRSVRGHGIGGRVLTEAAHKAVAFGAQRLVVNTTVSNIAALSALTRIGARIHPPTSDGRVSADIDLAAALDS